MAIKILNYVPQLAITFLPKFASILLSSQIDDESVSAIASLVIGCSSISKSNVEKFISKLISSAQKFNQFDIVSKAAAVIGAVGGKDESFGNSLLEKLSKSLETNATMFNILCIGELATNIDIKRHTALVDKLFDLIHSQDRGTFLAASESIGLASVASEVILERVIKCAKEDTSRIASYLFAFISLLKKLQTKSERADELREYYMQIAQFLIANANVQTETSQTFAEALCCLLKIDNSFVDGLLKAAKENPESGAAPVLIRSIGMLLETEKPDNTKQIVEDVMKLVKADNVVLSESCLYCLKVALSQNQSLISQLKFFGIACNCVKMVASHIVSEYYGAQQVTKDIGCQLRLNAVDAVYIYFNAQPSATDFKLLLGVAIEAIKDSNVEVQIHGMSLICAIAINKVTRPSLIKRVPMIVQTIQSLESAVFKSISAQLKEEYTRMVLYIHKMMGKAKVAEIQKLYKMLKDNPRVENMKQDYVLSVDNTMSQEVNLTGKGSMNYLLMNNFNEEAAQIFAK